MAKNAPQPAKTKWEVMNELLWHFGMGNFDDEGFWLSMKRNGWTNDDIDLYLAGAPPFGR